MMLWRISAASISCMIFVCLGGCAQDMATREHFELINPGSSTKLDVEQTMGTKYVDREDHWEYDRMDEHGYTAFIYYDDAGTVARKQWWDGEGLDDSDAEPEGDKVYDSTGASVVHE